MQQLTIVTVTYNSSAVINRLLTTLHAPEWNIIVVDNGSHDECSTIAASFPNVHVIASDNIGYGRAANVGFREVKTPYVLLVNPDVEITCETIRSMVACMERHPDIGILGANMSAIPAEGLQEVDWIVGALMLIRMEALAKVGMFDENIFLFYEETDLCKRFVKMGWRLAILQSAIARHEAGTSSPPSLKVLKIKAWHSAWSKAYYYHKHFSRLRTLKKCFTKITTTLFRISKYALLGNTRRTLQNSYELLGILAYMMGMEAFKNNVGRLT